MCICNLCLSEGARPIELCQSCQDDAERIAASDEVLDWLEQRKFKGTPLSPEAEREIRQLAEDLENSR